MEGRQHHPARYVRGHHGRFQYLATTTYYCRAVPGSGRAGPLHALCETRPLLGDARRFAWGGVGGWGVLGGGWVGVGWWGVGVGAGCGGVGGGGVSVRPFRISHASRLMPVKDGTT